MTIKHTPRQDPRPGTDEAWVDDVSGFRVERKSLGAFILDTGGGVNKAWFPSHRLSTVVSLLQRVKADRAGGEEEEGDFGPMNAAPDQRLQPGALIECGLCMYVVLADGSQRRIIMGTYGCADHLLSSPSNVDHRDRFIRRLEAGELSSLGLNADATLKNKEPG